MVQHAGQRQDDDPPIRPGFPIYVGPRLVLHYTGDALRVLHCIDALEGVLQVVGDPDNGSYEWVIIYKGEIMGHSDCGYGQSSVALRDGLIALHPDFKSEAI